MQEDCDLKYIKRSRVKNQSADCIYVSLCLGSLRYLLIHLLVLGIEPFTSCKQVVGKYPAFSPHCLGYFKFYHLRFRQ